MEITQVRVHLQEAEGSKLKAFVTVTFDNMFIVRDLKVIEGKKGLFVAMPSVKMKQACPACRRKVPIGSRYCSDCGGKLPQPVREPKIEDDGREDHKEIAHPITSEAREYIRSKVLDAFDSEKKKS